MTALRADCRVSLRNDISNEANGRHASHTPAPSQNNALLAHCSTPNRVGRSAIRPLGSPQVTLMRLPGRCSRHTRPGLLSCRTSSNGSVEYGWPNVEVEERSGLFVGVSKTPRGAVNELSGADFYRLHGPKQRRLRGQAYRRRSANVGDGLHFVRNAHIGAMGGRQPGLDDRALALRLLRSEGRASGIASHPGARRHDAKAETSFCRRIRCPSADEHSGEGLLMARAAQGAVFLRAVQAAREKPRRPTRAGRLSYWQIANAPRSVLPQTR